MDGKTEFRIAAAGGELAGVLSMADDGRCRTLNIVLSGHATASNGYVAYTIVSAIDSIEFESAEIDAKDMRFFEGRSVNNDSIEAVVVIVLSIVDKNRAVGLTVTGAATYDLLRKVFSIEEFASPLLLIRWRTAGSLSAHRSAA